MLGSNMGPECSLGDGRSTGGLTGGFMKGSSKWNSFSIDIPAILQTSKFEDHFHAKNN